MHPKIQFHILSWATLLLFPAVGLTFLWFFSDVDIIAVLAFDKVLSPLTLLGLEFGFIYGFFIIAITQFPVFEELSGPQMRILKSLKLNWFDIIFMSFCAGFGEEILFRAGLQTWLGPWLTSIIFIGVHGYFNPFSLRKSLLGIVLFPFILILSYAYEIFGLWFCIAAHFAYDLLMFTGVLNTKNK
ncbi:CPBP family intramembrane glutamic endopeptidase [Brumimicrobium aurantiacum]|uniref:CPBP family intramembrane metalloprotease n=1 Tax=Brumimicrobium aurantiacum TaxID=1737063 RepID=A0A3E1EXM1_9FLAO|nr:CPBP family intramembrane glutamic endopeptidase [Brumimicrobium aurantiacum]RFC54301.1 CPBP family intramembrane metalloprotease [Brumimicrobium aurantiacum]